MSSPHHLRSFQHNQHGAVLVVSLLLLLVMTILALSATQSTRLQERMAGNLRDSDLAFQAGEAGLRAGEKYFWDTITAGNKIADCATYSSGCPVVSKGIFPTDLSNQSTTWWSNNSTRYGTSTAQEISGVAADPRYAIEEYAFVPYALDDPTTGRTFYRITARANGGTDTATAVLQSTFAVPN